MTKKIILLTMVLILAFVFVGCGEQKSELDLIKDSITHQDSALLVGQNENYRLEVLTYHDTKSKVKSLEGDAPVDDVLIRLYVTHVGDTTGEYKVLLKNEDAKASQEIPLTKDVLGITYSATTDTSICNFNATKVDILTEKEPITLELQSAIEGAKVDSMKAVEMAYIELKDSMTDYFSEGKCLCHSEVKLIHNKRVPESPYYFYVAFIKDDDTYLSCLIDPKSGSVVNKKTK